MIFHLVSKANWQNAIRSGSYEPPTLKTEGFVHCSTRGQTADTANRLFRGRADLVLLCIDPARVAPEVRFEAPTDPADPRAHELFPHVYGPIKLDAVTQVIEFPCDAHGSFRLPDGL